MVITICSLSLTALLAPPLSYAQVDCEATNATEATTDASEDIKYCADGFTIKTEGDFRITTLTTNVRVLQGTMEILGDTAVLLSSIDGDELQKVTVHGEPAQFQQRATESGELTEGESDTIVFDTANQAGMRLITLTGDVSINRQVSKILGDHAELLENLTSHDIEKVTVHGQPARYQHISESTGETSEGNSDTIFYTLVDATIVEFVGNAEFIQPNNIISCTSVIYYPDDGERITSPGPCGGVFTQPDQ